MMKLLIIMGGFFPGKKYGGPPVSVDNFCSLMKNCECYIVTRNHDLFEKNCFDNICKGWNCRDNCKVLYLSDAEYNKKSFEKVFAEIKPDILYLQGLFQACVLPSLQLAKKYHIRVLLAPRGELCKGAIIKKKYKKLAYIVALKILGLFNKVHFQATSEEEYLAIKKYLGVENSHIHFLENIPSYPTKDYCKNKKKEGLAKFVYLSRIHPKKNLLYAIKLLKFLKGNIFFDIYGPIEDNNYWKECLEEIKLLPSNIKIEYKGLVAHENVHEVYSLHDAFIFPTESENFGHAIVESMMVGTPVIISNQTPWNDINHCYERCELAIPLENMNMFVEALQTIIDMNNSTYANMSSKVKKYICEKLDIISIKKRYSLVLEEITSIVS